MYVAKYCPICEKAAANNTTTLDHQCFKNWSGSSTSMESDIILEGFRRSVVMHKLKYINLLGDGNSSVYKKLCIERPYGPKTLIKKIECTNDLVRNYISKVRILSDKRMS